MSLPGQNANFTGQPALPSPTLTGTATEILASLENTEVILDSYIRTSDQLTKEMTEFESTLKATEVNLAGQDLRNGWMQYQALVYAYLQKCKDTTRSDPVKHNTQLLRDKVTPLLTLVAKAQVVLSNAKENRDREILEVAPPRPAPVWTGKSVDTLQPEYALSNDMSGSDFKTWQESMEIWCEASQFTLASPNIQLAFAKKWTSPDLYARIMEHATQADITLNFETFLQQAKVAFQDHSSLLIRRTNFFNLKPETNSPKSLITFMKQLSQEFNAAEMQELMSAEPFAVYRAICEMTPNLRSKVLYQKDGAEITYAEVMASLERIDGLNLYENTETKRRAVLRLSSGPQDPPPAKAPHSRGQAPDPSQNKQGGFRHRLRVPEGMNPNLCMRCGGDDHKADCCPVTSVNCQFCKMQNHSESVCFQKHRQLAAAQLTPNQTPEPQDGGATRRPLPATQYPPPPRTWQSPPRQRPPQAGKPPGEPHPNPLQTPHAPQQAAEEDHPSPLTHPDEG